MQEGDISENDKTTFEALFSNNKERVFNLLFHLIGHRQEAEDLSIEVFIIAHKNLHKFRYESEIFTWLYRIAVNLWRRQVKKKKIKPISLDSPIFNGSKTSLKDNLPFVENITNLEEAAQDKEIVRKAIEELPIKYKEIIVLYITEEKSYYEISQIMKLSVNLVGIRLMRARELLRKKLSQICNNNQI